MSVNLWIWILDRILICLPTIRGILIIATHRYNFWSKYAYFLSIVRPIHNVLTILSLKVNTVYTRVQADLSIWSDKKDLQNFIYVQKAIISSLKYKILACMIMVVFLSVFSLKFRICLHKILNFTNQTCLEV